MKFNLAFPLGILFYQASKKECTYNITHGAQICAGGYACSGASSMIKQRQFLQHDALAFPTQDKPNKPIARTLISFVPHYHSPATCFEEALEQESFYFSFSSGCRPRPVPAIASPGPFCPHGNQGTVKLSNPVSPP